MIDLAIARRTGMSYHDIVTLPTSVYLVLTDELQRETSTDR